VQYFVFKGFLLTSGPFTSGYSGVLVWVAWGRKGAGRNKIPVTQGEVIVPTCLKNQGN